MERRSVSAGGDYPTRPSHVVQLREAARLAATPAPAAAKPKAPR